MMPALLLAVFITFAASAAEAQLSVSDGGSRPVPDPTTLTTQQLDREIAALTALVQSWRDGDAALVAEKFASVTAQFQQRDQAVAAAFAAAATAVGKTEKSFADLLAVLDAKQAEATKNFDGRMQEILVRLAATEGQARGSGDTWAGIWGVIGAVGGTLVTLLVLAFRGRERERV